MRIGRTMLVEEIAVLGIASLLRALLGVPGDRAMIVAMGEGLLILAWCGVGADRVASLPRLGTPCLNPDRL
jgi:hypothetical protein